MTWREVRKARSSMDDNSKNHVITLTTTSDYNTAGKQHIGRITGPDRKFGLALDFVGSKSGKRGDVTTAKVTSPGLYKLRTTTRKGIDDTYTIIWDDPDLGLTEDDVDEQRAVEIAKGGLSIAEINAAGKRAAIEWQETRLAATRRQPDDEQVVLKGTVGTLEPGSYALGIVRAARRAELARLRGEVASDLPVEIGDAPSDPSFRRRALEDERKALLARLSEIDTELAGYIQGQQ